MFRSHALRLQIGSTQVCRRCSPGGVFRLVRAHFTTDNRQGGNKRLPEGRDGRNREDANLSSSVLGRREEGVGINRKENHSVKEILRRILSQIVDLKHTLGNLHELSPIWTQDEDFQQEVRHEAFQILKTIISDFEHQIKLNIIKANGKNRHECSVLLEEIFRLLSLCGPQVDGLSSFDECRRLMDLMENEWKIDLQHNHYEYAIVCAGREKRWSEASDVFWRHIDPARGGYNPCDISISEPVGLYVTARDAQESNLLVVERVFDAVLRMSMVSPSDQERCKFNGNHS